MKDAFIVNYTISLIKIFFSKYQCGFRKGFNTQHALLVMIEKMKTSCDYKEFCVDILIDLAKAFDFICHDLLLIAKLNSYGFERNALKLMTDRKKGRFFFHCLFRHYLWYTTGIYTWISAV